MLLEEGVRHRLGTMKPRPAVEAMNEIQVIGIMYLLNNVKMRFYELSVILVHYGFNRLFFIYLLYENTFAKTIIFL